MTFSTCLIATCVMAGKNATDTARISHVIDGTISEWNQDKFETDKDTEIQYAVDEDGTNLYLAMKVPNMRTQMKMMMQGMKLFVDTKGKRRERTGIEFPVKTGSGGGFSQGGGNRGGEGSEPGQGGPPDFSAMRERLASHLLLIKTFGLEDLDDKTMMMGQTEGIGLSCGWDESNVFYIEYMIPISSLGKPTELKGKTLGIGWKLNGIESSGFGGGAGSFGGTAESATGRSSGRSGGGRSRGGGGGSFPSPGTTGNDSRFSEQNIWTKYILN
jgi:hypothetical protein